jgi:type IX secretion system PorP/SprF family membrane protein
MNTTITTYGKKSLLKWFVAIMVIYFLQCNSIFAQTPQFSQFYAAPLYLGPSFAGSTDGSRIVLNYRNQWPEIPGAFVTYAFSFDHYFHNYNSGLGVLLFRDQAGSGRLANTSGGLLYSYNFKLNQNWSVRPGINFMYQERTIDFSKLVFGDQLELDGTINPSGNTMDPMERRGYFDAASSVLFYSRTGWVGLAADHMMMPNQSLASEEENRIIPKFSLFGGFRLNYGSRLSQKTQESISVTALYKNQGTFNQLDVGAYWSKDPVSFGLLYRGIPLFNNHAGGIFNNDALVLMGGLRRENLRIGYSYDFTISRLINNTGGAHEISVIYQFNQGPPSKKQKAIPCPDGQMFW